MAGLALAQWLVYFGLLLAVTRPLGAHMARVFSGERTFLHPVLGGLERAAYRLLGIDPAQGMRWTGYAVSLLAFSCVSLLFSYAALRLQGLLPLNPQGFGARQMPPDLAFNTAVSFATNTDWQSYSPELTVSHFSNMVALAIHNWASAAVGLAVAVALIRGFAARAGSELGNFWADVVRATVYVLLPLSAAGALVYLALGVPQSFDAHAVAHTLEGSRQVIALGPVASQEVIKQLGTNGGGFFNASSAHPFENPSPLSNLFTLLLIWCIPAALPYTFGKLVGNVRQGWAIFGAMAALAVVGIVVCTAAEQAGTPHLAAAHVETLASAGQPGGNMEGKELRFGIHGSALFAAVTTGASCGAVNAMHDSFTPLGGLVLLFNMLSGEVIFGGVGAGLYGMLLFAVLAVFIAGLMVGRTPEYLGKKIERFEVQMAMLAMLLMAASVLGFSALSIVSVDATSSASNTGPHGFSEILYAFASATGNNGSAFAGLAANTPWYNLSLGLAMLVGRFMMIIPVLALAGALARKLPVPASSGTLPTDTLTFSGLLIGVVVLVGALTYMPALALGPIVEHFELRAAITH